MIAERKRWLSVHFAVCRMLSLISVILPKLQKFDYRRRRKRYFKSATYVVPSLIADC